MTLFTRCGPMEQTTTSPPSFSLTRRASSSAYPSDSLTSNERSASSIQVDSLLIRRMASLFATCFIKTRILIFGLRPSAFGLWSLVFGLWSLVFGLWSLVFDFRFEFPRPKTQDQR